MLAQYAIVPYVAQDEPVKHAKQATKQPANAMSELFGERLLQ